MSQTAAAGANPRVPLHQIFSFGALGMPVAAMALVYGVYLPRHFVSVGVGGFAAGASATFFAVTAAFFAVRLVDVAVDPTCALLMDRMKTPLGRYRPWLLLGAPLAMLGIYELLLPVHPVGLAYLIGWLIVSFLGISMMTLGLAAWSAVLATTYNDRSRLWAFTSPMGVVAVNLILLLPVLTGHRVIPGMKASMPVLGLILLFAFPIALVVTTVFTPERVVPRVEKARFTLGDYRKAITRPAMWRLILADLALALGPGTTGPLYVFYFHDAKGFTIADVSVMLIFYASAGILGALFWGGPVAQRFGKHRALQIACVCYSITQSILMAVPRVWPGYTWTDCIPTAISMFTVGFCAAAFLILIRAMVADVVDEVKLDQERDLTGLLYSMVTTTTKIGGSITIVIVYPVLALVGYNGAEGAVNGKGAIFGLEMCYLFAPVILVLFGGAMFFGYKLDARRHAEIRRALGEPDALASEETLIGLPDAEETAAPAT